MFKNIWKIAKTNKEVFPDDILLTDGNPTAIFKKVMINTDFEVGYEINREALDTYISENTRYFSTYLINYLSGIKLIKYVMLKKAKVAVILFKLLTVKN